MRRSVSVGLATSAYAVSFGACSVASGLSIVQTMRLSQLLFSGGSQFALVGILGAGGSGIAAVATSTMLGVRNGLYALQVSSILRVIGLPRLAAAHLTIDESTAVAISQERPRAQRLAFWVTGGVVFLGWNLATGVAAIGVAAAVLAAVVSPVAPAGRPLLVAAAAALVAGLLSRRSKGSGRPGPPDATGRPEVSA